MNVTLDRLHPHPQNPREHTLMQVDRIKKSLVANTQYKDVVVRPLNDTVDGLQILAGHGVVLAAAELGWTSLDVKVIDCDDATAMRILLIDNRLNDLGSYDNTALLAVLDSLPAFDATGYDQDYHDMLQRIVAATAPDGEDGTDPHDEWWDMPPVPKEIDGMTPIRRLIVGFASEEDYLRFVQTVGLVLNSKAKTVSTWYPPHERRLIKQLRVVGTR